MGHLLDQFEHALLVVFDWSSILLMAALIGIVGYAVLGRYAFGWSVAWSQEVAAAACLWMVATGAAAAWARRQHIVIDVLLRRLGGAASFVLRLLIELASLTLFAVIWLGAYRMMFTSAHNTTTALGISFTYLYLALVVGVGGMIVFSLIHLVRGLREPRADGL
ncbi:MAG: TRAP transporter small permease subunit [Geminicoccaceae bacterium]|nr:MAG: TRAP transporter small permease subunit [Geminicoccaceae bacterium]